MLTSDLFFVDFVFLYTVWKFQNFSVIQILREINYGESRSCKLPVFEIFEALDFVKW